MSKQKQSPSVDPTLKLLKAFDVRLQVLDDKLSEVTGEIAHPVVGAYGTIDFKDNFFERRFLHRNRRYLEVSGSIFHLKSGPSYWLPNVTDFTEIHFVFASNQEAPEFFHGSEKVETRRGKFLGYPTTQILTPDFTGKYFKLGQVGEQASWAFSTVIAK